MELEQTVAAPKSAAKKNPILSRVIRPLVSAALLVFLFQSIGFTKFMDLLTGADFLWLGVGLLVVVAALVISAYKWQWLLNAQEVQVPLLKLFTSYLIGQFFNNFLPTNIGGDVVRIADIGRYTGKMPEAAASVVGERILAGFALGLTAIFGLVLSYQVSSGFTGAVVGLVVVFGAVIALFASQRVRSFLGRRIQIPNVFSLRAKIEDTVKSMALSFSNPAVLLWVIVLSLAFHSTVILLNYVIFLALGVHVSLVYCFLFIPIIMAIQMVPISVNGLGLREGAYVYFFGFAGITAAPAVAASLLFWVLVTIVSLSGGVIFALRR